MDFAKQSGPKSSGALPDTEITLSEDWNQIPNTTFTFQQKLTRFSDRTVGSDYSTKRSGFTS